MELTPGQVAVVTGAGSGIGLALAERFASAGLHVVLADVQADALAVATEQVDRSGEGDVLAVPTDVSKEEAVAELAARTIERFGAVHVVCNNAGVAARADPWFGPLRSWEWVMGVNFWGVVHGCRTFLPHLIGGGHIVNTASMAGLMPGFGPSYDASKHAVVAISEDLYHAMDMSGLPVGVSVLCPGWVRTSIIDADRNWPAELGDKPQDDPTRGVMERHVRRAIDEGVQPAFIADAVADAVEAGRFWVIPQTEFLDLAVGRWATIGERADPVPNEHVPGMPPRSQIVAEVMAALGLEAAPAPGPTS
jgi:NAD(P)-dependent dehydrogenase (short-subunit alcohol dehydrogenase family)